jgi:hypothetical protein
MHQNPEFNKLDIKDLKQRIPSLDMTRGRPKISPFIPKLSSNVIYSFKQPKEVTSPTFSKMLERCEINSIYHKTTKVPDYYPPPLPLKVSTGCLLEINKQKKRDLLMYSQTERLKNIQNDNERYKLLQDILKQL